MTNDGRWRGVGVALAIGSAYDLAFALLILGLAGPAASVMGLTLPEDPVYLELNGILLLLLAAIYAAASRDPERYRAVAPLAGAGRLIGCAFFVWVFLSGRPKAFLALGLLDLALGIATLALWRRASVVSA